MNLELIRSNSLGHNMGPFTEITSYGHGAFKVIIVAALLIMMQFLMVGGRFISRKMRKASLAADDYVLLTAAIITIGFCGLAIACKSTQTISWKMESQICWTD